MQTFLKIIRSLIMFVIAVIVLELGYIVWKSSTYAPYVLIGYLSRLYILVPLLLLAYGTSLLRALLGGYHRSEQPQTNLPELPPRQHDDEPRRWRDQ